MTLRARLRRLTALAFRRRLDATLAEEMRFHLEMKALELERAGMTAEQARRAAMRDFGNIEITREESRDVWTSGRLERLWQDLRYGFRMLWKNPGLTTVVVLTLGVAVGANSAIFSVVNACLLRPLPFPDAHQLIVLWDRQPQDKTVASLPEFEGWRDNARSLTDAVAWFTVSTNLIGAQEPHRVRTLLASRGYFKMFGVQPLVGRVFTPEDNKPGAPPNAIISEDLWRTRFGAAADVAGKPMVLDRTTYTIVGVVDGTSLRFGSSRSIDVWTPLERAAPWRDAGTHYLFVVARLKPGTGLEQARTDLVSTTKRLDEQLKHGHGIEVQPLQEALYGDARVSLYLLAGAATFLLLIATANVASLLLARAMARGREFAVRSALGAGRGRLARQCLVETVLLAGLGGCGGLALAVWFSHLLPRWWPAGIPRPESVAPDWRVFAFGIVTALISGLLFGLAPAFQTARGSLNEQLGLGGFRVAGGDRQGLRSALIMGEVAVATVLLIGAGLLLRSFDRVLHTDPGFVPANVLTLYTNLPNAKYKKPEQRQVFFDDLLARLRRYPQTVAAGAVMNLPLGQGGTNGDFIIEGRDFPKNVNLVSEKEVVAGDYFRAMGTRLLSGRVFDERDRPGAPSVAIINETLARRFWPNGDSLGKRIDIHFGVAGTQEIVGVVSDIKREGLDRASVLEIYVPYWQASVNGMALVVRTTGDPMQMAQPARREVQAIDSEQPVFAIQTMDEVVANSLSQRRLSTFLLAFFGAAALLLASLGIYGAISYWVAQRTREIGVRTALGARRQDILVMVVRRGVLLAAVGLASGLALSLPLVGLLRTVLFGVSPFDTWTFIAAAAILLAVSILASAIPARRAGSLDPVAALRIE